MATPAQDEFEALVSSKDRTSTHPEDAFDDTTTLAPSTISMSTTTAPSVRIAKKSLRSRNSNTSKYPYRDSSDEDEEPEPQGKKNAYYLPKSYQYDAMTGPKGVIADAQAFEKEKNGGRNHSFDRTKELALPRAQWNGSEPPRRKSQNENAKSSGSENDEDLNSDDDSDEVRTWKAKRRREIEMQAIRRGRLNRQYGTVEVVDGMRFLEAIERAGRGAVVVVYIYDDQVRRVPCVCLSQKNLLMRCFFVQSGLSDAFLSHLVPIAADHSQVQFIALHCAEAEIDAAAVPAILAYRNGEKFADLMPLVDEVSLTRNVVTNLEAALQRYDAFQ